MKIIISHDVDHLSVKEHLLNDLYLPKLFIRDIYHLLFLRISFGEYLLRLKEILNNKISYIKELCEYNKENNIPATFFLAVKKGRSLSYSNKQLNQAITLINTYEKTDCLIHGIEIKNIHNLKNEKLEFTRVTGINPSGIRMHYLSKKDNIQNLHNAKYSFDSSLYGIKNPYKINGIIEFPIQLMDVFDVPNIKFSDSNFNVIKNNTINKIKDCEKRGLKYLVVDFHDRYFSEAYLNYFEWYKFLINYLISNNYVFSSFKDIDLKNIK